MAGTPMSRYASGTEVPVDRSQAEIRRTLKRYGVTRSTFNEAPGAASVEFVGHGRMVRFVINLPDPADERFTLTPTGRDRAAAAARQAFDQAERQCWRALNLLIKAKLEAVEAGVQSFEDEFLPYTLLPGGATVADALRDPVACSYATGAPLQLPPQQRLAIGP
jgi:hypothetical protein